VDHENYPIDRTPSLWDRVWRGRSSSLRRNLDNCALEASRCATLIREAAREADTVSGPRRSAALHAIRDEILNLTDDLRGPVCDFILAEAGRRPDRANVAVRGWRAIRRDFMRWLHG